MNQNKIITYIEMHDETIDVINPNEYKFGIIHIKTPKVEITKTPLAIYMNIDRSGSMGDICSDGRTKMTHLKHTILNIIQLFPTYTDVNVSICIVVFDSIVEELTKGFELITIENVEYFYKLINNIRPMGTTNIEHSLKNALNRISEYNNKNPTVRPIHIQFTDGEASSGKTEKHELLKNINPSYKNIFIGFGELHDSYLLSCFAEYGGVGKSEYRFIDQIENSGMVCGEILYNILYPYTVECLTINMVKDENGKSMKIYNWITNEWVSSMIIPPLSSDCEKIYHIQGEGICNAELVLCGNCIEYIDCIPDLIDNESLEKCTRDLTKYIFRQKTLELLYESRQLESYRRYIEATGDSSQYELKDYSMNNSSINKKTIELLRSRLLNLFKILQEYWETLDNEPEKTFIKILMDDLHIACKTLGTEYGYMYSCSRQLSQGSQFTYKVGGTNDTEQYDDIGYLKGCEYITSPSTKTPVKNEKILEFMHKICNDCSSRQEHYWNDDDDDDDDDDDIVII